MAHHVKVRPVRLRDHFEPLAVDRLRVIGYRASCSCGARGRVKPTYFAARLWTFDHLGRHPARH